MSARHYCGTCDDTGVLAVTDGEIKTLARCYCSQGKLQPWALPTIPIVGFKHERLAWQEYKPRDEAQRTQKIEWHKERVKNAEEFWAHHERGEL